MINMLSRLSLSIRVTLLAFLVTVSICVLLGLSYTNLKEALYTQYTEETKHLVQSAHATLYHFDKQVQLKKIDLASAQKMALNHIHDLNYGMNGYFWVNDTQGMMLSHPEKALVNTNMLDQKDAHGKEFIKEIISTATKQREGTVTYYWPPDSGKQKLSYVALFPQWNWILGSGVHTDNIEKQTQEIFRKLILASLFILPLLFLAAMAIGKTITRPLITIDNALQKVLAGDLNADLKHIPNNGDSINRIAHTAQELIQNARLTSKLESEKKDLEKTKNEFVSIVSHELRTPLTSIKGSLGLVLGTMKDSLPEKTYHLINIAHENCDRLITLVNDLLDIDKTASGEMTVDIRNYALHPILQIAAENCEAYAKKYHVKLNYTPIDKSIFIDIDRDRLLQILSNLISNAAKFSPAGGTINLGAKQESSNIRIFVEDHGLGIPKKARKAIFTKFAQADSSASRKKSGTGLGLTISKNLVELMNGEITFDTKDGFGTTFWVTFPLTKQKDKPTEKT